jgi:hypothetical protein
MLSKRSEQLKPESRSGAVRWYGEHRRLRIELRSSLIGISLIELFQEA